MENTNTVLMGIPRREIFAFQQWLRNLPRDKTTFLYQTFDSEEVRKNKVQELYKQYKSEAS